MIWLWVAFSVFFIFSWKWFFSPFSTWRKAWEPNTHHPSSPPQSCPVPAPNLWNDFFKQGNLTFKQKANFAKLTKSKFGPFWYFGMSSSTTTDFKNAFYMTFRHNFIYTTYILPCLLSDEKLSTSFPGIWRYSLHLFVLIYNLVTQETKPTARATLTKGEEYFL